jgi:eukaryotic-like serine/threonine-protein kinase
MGTMTATTRPLAPGDRLGNYVLEGLHAQGGMGAVYLAHHARGPRRAAIKVMHAHVADPHGRERIFREAGILRALIHPAVATVYELGLLPDGRPWIAMELIDGETLGERVARRGALPLRAAVEIIVSIADVLAAAHQAGIVHRDVKPDNVMLVASGVPCIKLLDWGFARARTSPRLTDLETTPGTPAYMSPEQVQGRTIDERSDVYSLGVVAYELVTGRPPFKGACAVETALQHITVAPAPCSSVCPQVPLALEALILQMLAKAPAARPTLVDVCKRLIAMELMSDDLDDLDEEPTPVQRPGLPARMRWTPPYGTVAAQLSTIATGSAATRTPTRGEVRRGAVIRYTPDQQCASGEFECRRGPAQKPS